MRYRSLRRIEPPRFALVSISAKGYDGQGEGQAGSTLKKPAAELLKPL
jgi:hypothetical protein